MRYIRVLPIMIITAFGLLSFRVHNIWQSANVEPPVITQTKQVASKTIPIPARTQSAKSNSLNKNPLTAPLTNKHGKSLIGFNSAVAADNADANNPAKASATNTATADKSNADTSKELEGDDPQFMSQEEITVLSKLSARRRELDKRAVELDRKEKFMSAAEVRINNKIKQMKQLETSINAKIKEADAKHKQDLQSLVKVYEGMKPADAATILAELEPDVLLALVGKMKQKSLALIFASMPPAKARDITVELARKKELIGE